jgi:DNA-directed RNA polymerase subunit RPC12/RpoP
MEPTIRVVRCPCCKGPLYTLSTVSPRGEAGWQLANGGPELQQDRDGPFMKCPRCSRRIAIVKNRKSPGAPPFEVVVNQKCDQILR